MANDDRTKRPALNIVLAEPRGFCAGVERAIQIVENALATYGAPVYVRHEIVHNAFVVEDLRSKGAIFVEELDEIPPTDQPVIFSAHGVPKSVPEDAKSRNMFYVDATCPLVSKVHIEATRQHEAGNEIILIGHAGHPEVIGTIGQLPEGAISLVENLAGAEAINPRDPDHLAYVTQTTLSIDDTSEIVGCLKHRFPKIAGPHKEDICYATTNRQAAVKAIAARVDALIVVGAPNSSNSRRLVEVAIRAGCRRSFLVEGAREIDWSAIGEVRAVGLTAGASAPEVLVEAVIEAFRTRFEVTVETVETAREDVVFKLPREVASVAAL